MSYINFKMLYRKGLSDTDYMLLLKVHQKDFRLIQDEKKEVIDRLVEEEFLTYLKKKEGDINSLRLTKKCSDFFRELETYEFDESVLVLEDRLIKLYELNNKTIGVKAKIRENLMWFISATGFGVEVVYKIVEDYVNDCINNQRNIMYLENLIWKQPNVFSVRRSLKDSVLFDMISKRYGLGEAERFEDKKGATYDWVFGLSKLTPPKKMDKSLYMTGCYDGDVRFLKTIKKELIKLIKGVENEEKQLKDE